MNGAMRTLRRAKRSGPDLPGNRVRAITHAHLPHPVGVALAGVIGDLAFGMSRWSGKVEVVSANSKEFLEDHGVRNIFSLSNG